LLHKFDRKQLRASSPARSYVVVIKLCDNINPLQHYIKQKISKNPSEKIYRKKTTIRRMKTV